MTQRAHQPTNLPAACTTVSAHVLLRWTPQCRSMTSVDSWRIDGSRGRRLRRPMAARKIAPNFNMTYIHLQTWLGFSWIFYCHVGFFGGGYKGRRNPSHWHKKRCPSAIGFEVFTHVFVSNHVQDVVVKILVPAMKGFFPSVPSAVPSMLIHLHCCNSQIGVPTYLENMAESMISV